MGEMAAGVAAPFEFLLSGFTEPRSKRNIMTKIRALGGTANNAPTYDVSKCTHVISYKPISSEKFICGVASGKWILKPEFITDSFDKDKWQAESTYEWSEADASENVLPGLLTAPRRWREKIAASGHGAFHDWKVLLHVTNDAVRRRVLEAGGGQCVPVTFPIKEPAALVSLVTHVIVDKCHEKDVQCLKERGIQCLPPECIKEHLFQENPNMTKYRVSSALMTPPETIRQRNIPTVKAKKDHDTFLNRKQTNPSGRESDTPVLMVSLAEEGTSSDPGSSVKRKLELESPKEPEQLQIPKKRKPMELNLIPPPKPQTETSMDLMRKYGIEEFEMEYTESDYDELINYKLYTDNMRPLLLEYAPKLHSRKRVNLLAALWKEFAASNPKKKKPLSTSVLDFKPADEAKEAEVEEEEDGGGGDDNEAKRESLEVNVKVQEEEKEEEVKEKKGGKDASTSKAVYVRRSERQQSNTKKDEVSGGIIADHSPKSLPRKFNVNRKNGKGETPLQLACFKNDITKVRELLNKPDIDVNARDNAGWTPLHEACIRGHTASVKELLKFASGKRMVTSTESRGMQTLDFLAAPSECGNTPLHDAVFNNHIEVVKLLVEAGGSILLTAKNKAGFTPFGMALTEVMKEAMLGQRSEVSRLPAVDEENENNASTSKAENVRRSERLQSNTRKDEVSGGIIADHSLKTSPRKTNENRKGETLLHEACIKNNITKVRELLNEPDIDVNAQDGAGWTPLHEACNHGHTVCVKELLKFAPGKRMVTSTEGRSMQTLDLLAAPSKCGTTPLHDAVYNNRIEVVKLLVEAGGSNLLTVRNKKGFTPVDMAQTEVMKEAILGQRSEVSRLSAVDEKNENGRIPLTFKKNTGSTPVDMTQTEIMKAPIPSQRSGVIRLPAIDEENKNRRILLAGVRNKAGLTPVDIAQTEVMKEANLGLRPAVSTLSAVSEENENSLQGE
ncbi:uncharacterized protein LOC100892411 isoform X2 [Strongylocentrotus purpuratus]|uniref:BRCT domain-containing protein n=1 Tax=Strongylocentrotus purpuratus TaxID=7668 RepID=A0A7M7PEN5_STRPU|nr:uncharacterized protein LOC100892411 isoform X2 [Strongylocentrotus purpuratus]